MGGLTGWTIIEAAAGVADTKHQIAAGQAGPVVAAEHGVAPHSTGLTACFAGFRHVKVDRDAPVLVGLDGDRLDAVCPAFFIRKKRKLEVKLLV